MEEKTKKILAYSILPVIFTGVIAHSSFEVVTGKKREDEPHIPENNFPIVSFIQRNYVVSLNASASVVSILGQYITNKQK